MNYYALINRFWRLNKEQQFSSGEVHLYFKLLDTCNLLGWKKSFKQSTKFQTGETGLCERHLIKCRNRLKAAGLIDYFSPKSKCESGVYSIIMEEFPDDNRTTNSEIYTIQDNSTGQENILKADYGLPEIEDYSIEIIDEDPPLVESPKNNTQDLSQCLDTENLNSTDPGTDQSSIKVQPEADQSSIKVQPESDQSSTIVQTIHDQSMTKVQPKSDQSMTKVQPKSDFSADNIRLDIDLFKEKRKNKKKKKRKEKKLGEEEKTSSPSEAEDKVVCYEILKKYNEICTDLPVAISLNKSRISKLFLDLTYSTIKFQRIAILTVEALKSIANSCFLFYFLSEPQKVAKKAFCVATGTKAKFQPVRAPKPKLDLLIA
jgi:hypothetical protein